MARTLGIVTIGQAPRDDIATLFATHAPGGTKVILRGALDGLSDAEVDRLQPENGGDTLYTRLRGGRDVKISKSSPVRRRTSTSCVAMVATCWSMPVPGSFR